MIARGDLAPLRSKATEAELSVEGVGKRGGEFIEHELQAAVNNAGDNERIVDEVLKRAGGRKAWLFFCAGVEHAEAMKKALVKAGVTAECLTGKTDAKCRDDIIARFRTGEITALTNCQVLTTGFDYPDIDLIALCRPTMSPGLYIQTVGRGMRIAPGKTDCLVLDFAGNVKRHGPITAVKPPKHKGAGTGDAPVKICPECAELIHTSIKTCPCCGYEFPPALKEAVRLHDDDIMGIAPICMKVRAWYWYVRKSRAKEIDMLCVDYEDAVLTGEKVTEYITILHDGYARWRAQTTLDAIVRGCGGFIGDIAVTEENLEQIAEVLNNAAPPEYIDIKKDGKYYRVLDRRWKERAAVGA